MTTNPKQVLWLICELYYPEVNATGHYVTQIGTGLADVFDVRVICAQPNYLSKGLRAPWQETYKGVEIFRVRSTTLNKDVVLFRIVNMLTIGISMFVKCVRSFRTGDKVLVVTAPPSLPYTTALAALFNGASYTVILHDLYPDVLVAVGRTKVGSGLYRLTEFLNRWLYKHSNRLIVVGRDMYARITGKTDGLDVSVVTIPNWADLDAIEPTPKDVNPLLMELGISDKFVLMYAGNIGHPTDIETIVEAADLLRKETSIHFLFVGSGAKKRWLDREVRAQGLANISILGQRPREEQNVFLNACDVGLVSLVPGMVGNAMPSRTYNILAAGRPILALTEDGSELAQVIDEEAVGWHIPPKDPTVLADLILKIKDMRWKLDEMARRARLAAVSKYSPETAIEKYRLALS